MSNHFNWKQLCSNYTGFETLRQELCQCGGRYILDRVTMPDTCKNALCNIEFRYFRNGSIALLYTNARIHYTGSDPIIREWIVKGIMEFKDFSQLTDFLTRFKDDTPRCSDNSNPNRENSEQQTPPERPQMHYNRDNICVNTAANTYSVIDKSKLKAYVNNAIFGQEESIDKIVHLVCNHIATKHKTRPLSIFLHGPTGVGKSAVVERITEGINRQVKDSKRYAYRPVDCTQFQERYDISRLTGASPGYVGFDEPGVFSVLEDNLNTIFVFEEIEKASSNVTEVIMQAMETGKQETNGKTLSNGKQYYDLSNAIIFFTSNIDIETKEKSIGFSGVNDDEFHPKTPQKEDNGTIAKLIARETKESREKLVLTGKFRREVVGRMSAIIKFNPIADSAMVDIAAKSISDIAQKDHLLYITELGDDILQQFLDECVTEVQQFGVRAFRAEAQYYFSDVFREFSHSHADFTHVSLKGSLNNPTIEISEYPT